MPYGDYPKYPQQVPVPQPQSWQYGNQSIPSYGYTQAGQNSYTSQPNNMMPTKMTVDYIQGGYNSALAYPKPEPGTGVMLVDQEQGLFFVKKTDFSGMPLPITGASFNELDMREFGRSNMSGSPDMNRYMTKDEFRNEFKHMMDEYFGPNANGADKK